MMISEKKCIAETTVNRLIRYCEMDNKADTDPYAADEQILGNAKTTAMENDWRLGDGPFIIIACVHGWGSTAHWW